MADILLVATAVVAGYSGLGLDNTSRALESSDETWGNASGAFRGATWNNRLSRETADPAPLMNQSAAVVSNSPTHDINKSVPAVMSVSDVVNNTNSPAVMSGNVIDQTQTQEMTPVKTNRMDAEAEDDSLSFLVELGDLTFSVCSDLMVCKNRCETMPSSVMEEQHVIRKKRQTPVSDKQEKEFESISQNVPRRNKLQEYQTKPMPPKETEIEKDLEQSFPSRIQTETRRQQKFSQRKTRAVSGSMSDAKCPNNLQNFTCFCDDACVLYGDCCVDVFQNCFSKTNTADIVDIIYDTNKKVNFTTTSGNLDEMAKKSPNKADLILASFLSNFASCEKVNWDTYVFLVSLCPPDFPDMELRFSCENSEASLLPPVSATVSAGYVSFKNIYCAQCHSIHTEDLQPWLVNLDCNITHGDNNIRRSTITVFSELVRSKKCNLTFTIPVGICHPRLCEPASRLSRIQKQQIELNVKTGTCSHEDATLCQTYISGDLYRNPSCARCLNFAHLSLKQGEIINMCNVTNPYLEPPPDPDPRSEGSHGFGGILIILDITGIYTEHKEKTSFYVCEDDEVFDPFFLQCKTLICTSGFEPFRGKCVDTLTTFFVPESSQIFPQGWARLDILTNTSETSSYISCGQIFENTEATNPHKHFAVDKVLIIDYKDINGSFAENISTLFFECEEYITRQQSNCLQSVDVILSITQNISLDTIYELEQLVESLIPLRSNDQAFQISLSNMRGSATQASACTNGTVLAQRSDFSLVEYKGVAYVVFNHTQQGVYYPLSNIGYELTIAVSGKAGDSLNLLYQVYVCQEWQLLLRENCSIVVYLLNETQQEDSRLLIKASNEYYEEGDYYAAGYQVYVCSKFEFKVQQESGKENIAYIVITSAFTALSITCLLIMIIIYCVFPELQSLPGKMSATLAGTMMLTFLANLFTLTKLHNDYICPVLAAVSHVITLSHFGWMAAISVNMALTFGPGIHSLARSHDDKKAYFRYSITVWGPSLAIVLTSIIMDFSHRGDNTNLNLTASATTGEIASSISVSNYPRYGKPFCTWFSGPLWARLSFVIIPYFITYIISTTGFLLTLVGIHQSNKSAEKVGIKTSEKTLCLIYLKLSTAMGFAWILSVVVSSYPDSEVLPYIYVCLVLLQGVLLFLAFTANRKVYSLIMKKYVSLYKASSEDTTQISSVMTNTL